MKIHLAVLASLHVVTQTDTAKVIIEFRELFTVNTTKKISYGHEHRFRSDVSSTARAPQFTH
jgi:hypothetical protein